MSEAIPFLKMNGSGNDFVVVDTRTSGHSFTAEQIRAIANRESGIGCDQFITMEATRVDGADIFMRIYNEDGQEVDACGNASRCVAALLTQQTKRANTTLATNAGLLIAHINGDLVTVDMGVPHFNWDKIPLAEEFADTSGIELQIGPIDNPILHTPSVVNVGNPHATFWVSDDPDRFDLHLFGPLLENHPIFPERANIEIAQILSPERIKVRVWERGVGLTKACGTGACAVAVSGMRKKLVGRKVTIDLPGGPLQIEWRKSDNHILMTGPWSLDGRGKIPAELLDGVAA